jgi:hypothetical protein|tara:strand:+ start:4942 stop:5103 length:162 start_codon:yes stop_codon:yes gene_type:complete
MKPHTINVDGKPHSIISRIGNTIELVDNKTQTRLWLKLNATDAAELDKELAEK